MNRQTDADFHKDLHHTDPPCLACSLIHTRRKDQERLHRLRLDLLDGDNAGQMFSSPTGPRRLTETEKRALYHALDYHSLVAAVDAIFPAAQVEIARLKAQASAVAKRISELEAAQ